MAMLANLELWVDDEVFPASMPEEGELTRKTIELPHRPTGWVSLGITAQDVERMLELRGRLAELKDHENHTLLRFRLDEVDPELKLVTGRPERPEAAEAALPHDAHAHAHVHAEPRRGLLPPLERAPVTS